MIFRYIPFLWWFLRPFPRNVFRYTQFLKVSSEVYPSQLTTPDTRISDCPLFWVVFFRAYFSQNTRIAFDSTFLLPYTNVLRLTFVFGEETYWFPLLAYQLSPANDVSFSLELLHQSGLILSIPRISRVTQTLSIARG